MAVRGIERVRANIKRHLNDIATTKTERAVYAVLSQGRALADTMTPIKTSNLINSGYAPDITVTATRVSGHIGYTAEYAAAVHEAPGTLRGQPRPDGSGNYWAPRGEPKFLTKGFEQLDVQSILKAAYAG